MRASPPDSEEPLRQAGETSTYIQTSRDVRAVYGILSELYDGDLRGHWRSGQTVDYEGFMTKLFAGVQFPGAMDAELGPRLPVIRLSPAEIDWETMAEKREVLRIREEQYLLENLAKISQAPTDESKRQVEKPVKRLAKVRAYVPRDRSHGVHDEPVDEFPARLTGLLAVCLPAWLVCGDANRMSQEY